LAATRHDAVLTREEVAHIAELAKLRVTDEEVDLFRHQLSQILDYAAKIRELDTDAIPPTASVLDLENVMRPDEVEECLPRDAALANAPDAEAGQFRVKAVLE
jgi:aspartyl-tRNA(Asn)/glutamyl-tRNA(Gln) amidotransferase subunit C